MYVRAVSPMAICGGGFVVPNRSRYVTGCRSGSPDRQPSTTAVEVRPWLGGVGSNGKIGGELKRVRNDHTGPDVSIPSSSRATTRQ